MECVRRRLRPELGAPLDALLDRAHAVQRADADSSRKGGERVLGRVCVGGGKTEKNMFFCFCDPPGPDVDVAVV